MTSAKHNSGTERLAEVCDKYNFDPDQIIVNVQGDEPLIPGGNINQVYEGLRNNERANMSTLAVPIREAEDMYNPNVVKVVTDKDGYAMYFSRAGIPCDRERPGRGGALQGCPLRHVGIYAYTASFLREYVTWQPTALEQLEALEQLRALWYGKKIHVQVAAEAPPAGVDTEEDLQRIRAYIAAHKLY